MLEDDADRRAFFDGVSFAPDHLLNEWTARLRSGERTPEADGLARAILRDFCLRQFLGRPHSTVALDWLADILSDILDDAEPRSALGLLPRPAHRPSDGTKAVDIAWWMSLAMERGYTRPEAKELATTVFSVDLKTVERYFKKGAPWIDGMNPSANWERYFCSCNRPLPPPK
jgi:hypothetical protein